ncbi:hypothetical protein B0T26DRAFT_700427 [Lasiosphaeria miniovina]|uniref:Secreted protein n=1 Tax=Lasiosphaeria miniovina TaxID=1954250 RepID=A0AA40ATS3_9PEZI|nr:uncharacterized protein B0T26DRAFT_700427 [Lasiosphaeria miniovina]KAK0721838.1 hypothetical protein B0T26DRAFT_700427 [Lasiosphaeria miniovina]
MGFGFVFCLGRFAILGSTTAVPNIELNYMVYSSNPVAPSRDIPGAIKLTAMIHIIPCPFSEQCHRFLQPIRGGREIWTQEVVY